MPAFLFVKYKFPALASNASPSTKTPEKTIIRMCLNVYLKQIRDLIGFKD